MTHFFCSVGFMAIRHYDLMLGKDMRDLYYEYLGDEDSSDRLRIQVRFRILYSAFLLLFQHGDVHVYMYSMVILHVLGVEKPSELFTGRGSPDAQS